MNTIRDLLELGFSGKEIKEYFKNRNVQSTFQMLKDEKSRVKRKINELKRLKDNIDVRLKGINATKKIAYNQIIKKHFEERKCYRISVGYKDDDEMNILIKRLIDIDENYYYVIGNHQIGSIIPVNDYLTNDQIKYNSVFILAKNGTTKIEKGEYLTYTYKGNYKQSKYAIDKLYEYVKNNNLKIMSNILEILWIDIHSTDNEEEYVTELQLRVG